MEVDAPSMGISDWKATVIDPRASNSARLEAAIKLRVEDEGSLTYDLGAESDRELMGAVVLGLVNSGYAVTRNGTTISVVKRPSA